MSKAREQVVPVAIVVLAAGTRLRNSKVVSRADPTELEEPSRKPDDGQLSTAGSFGA